MKAQEAEHDYQGFESMSDYLLEETDAQKARAKCSKGEGFKQGKGKESGRCREDEQVAAGYMGDVHPQHRGRQSALKLEATGTWKRPQGYSCSQKEQLGEQGPGQHVSNIPPWAVTWANEIALLLSGKFPLANAQQSFIQYSRSLLVINLSP